MVFLLLGFSIKAKPFFFEIFSHAPVYVRGDDERNIYERSEYIIE